MLVVTFGVFVLNFDFYFFCLWWFENFCFVFWQMNFARKFQLGDLLYPFSSVIFRLLWVRCLVGILLFLSVIFQITCCAFFWLCVIYFGNIISQCISFGVFVDFLVFGSAVFISLWVFLCWVYLNFFFNVALHNLTAFLHSSIELWPIVFCSGRDFRYIFFSYV